MSVQNVSSGSPCEFCGAFGVAFGDPHTEECKDQWRAIILSYEVSKHDTQD